MQRSDSITAIKDRVDDLEDELAQFRNERRSIQQHEIEPTLDALRDACDDARQERAELADRVNRLEEMVHGFAGQLETLHGVTDPDNSSPEKRRLDLAQALIRRAEAKTDAKGGAASMYWKEVQNMFAEHGHGEVKKPLCYKAMRELFDQPGFSEGTKRSKHGNQVEAVRVKLADLPGEEGSNDITTSELGAAGVQDGKQTVEVTND